MFYVELIVREKNRAIQYDRSRLPKEKANGIALLIEFARNLPCQRLRVTGVLTLLRCIFVLGNDNDIGTKQCDDCHSLSMFLH